MDASAQTPKARTSVVRAAFVAMIFVTTAAQAQSGTSAPAIHIVYMGGNDCPPCRVWRGMELPKLEATEIYKRIKFTYVTKGIASSVPPTFFLPDDVKPYKDVLDYASNGNSGSSQTAILVNGKVFDYYFGFRSAADVEKMLMAIESGGQYPFARCMRFIKSSAPRTCESRG